MDHLGRTTGTILSIFYPDQPESNQMYQGLKVAKVLLSDLYTVVLTHRKQTVGLLKRQILTANVQWYMQGYTGVHSFSAILREKSCENHWETPYFAQYRKNYVPLQFLINSCRHLQLMSTFSKASYIYLLTSSKRLNPIENCKEEIVNSQGVPKSMISNVRMYFLGSTKSLSRKT